MSSREHILNQIIALTEAKYPESEVYLFGSQAKGNFTEISDWDLLILLNSEGVSFEAETNVMDAFYELELETGAVISPLIYSKLEWNKNYSVTPLFSTIKKEGVKLR